MKAESEASLIACFILQLVCFEVHCSLRYVRSVYRKEGSFCIDVLLSSDQRNGQHDVPELALVLEVDYPQSIAQAGYVIFAGSDLTYGKHNVSYKYLITNMTHDLKVWLDGEERRFTKSRVSRWYSVSTFKELLILVQGRVMLQCSDVKRIDFSTAEKEPSYESHFDVSVEDAAGEFFINSQDTGDNVSFTEELDEVASDSSVWTDTSLPNVSAIGLPQVWPSSGSNVADNESELSDPSAVQGCFGEECRTNYSLAAILFGVLGGLTFIALVVSLVFYQKNKKLKLSRPKLSNRMHILYETVNTTGEVQEMIDKL